MTALMAASRTAMTMLGTVLQSKPARSAKSSAVLSTVSTLSIEEPSVSETRLVVESGNLVPVAGTSRVLDAVAAMMEVCLWNDRMSRIAGERAVEAGQERMSRSMKVWFKSDAGGAVTAPGGVGCGKGFARAAQVELCL